MDKAFNQYLQNKQKIINRALDQYLPPAAASHIAKVMRYSVMSGGKRLRAILMLAVADAFEIPKDRVLPAACAVELLHAFTLVHDDLPSMDNDDYRRGQLTAHKKFGEAMAILAGDALQSQAFATLLKTGKVVPDAVLLKAMRILIDAIGINGVVNGQVLDIQSENRKITSQQLNQIHQLKTGALMVAAVSVAATLCQANPKQIRQAITYARHLGLAFQIADDILDYTSSFDKMGKQPGSDKKLKKATYVSLHGLKLSRQKLSQEHQAACAALGFLGNKARWLKEIAEFTVSREN